MDQLQASKILRDQRVDISFDPRPAQDILVAMVEQGHLPGHLLEQAVDVVPVDIDSEV